MDAIVGESQVLLLRHVQHTEAALHASEAQFQALVEASAQIVWSTDVDGAVVDDSLSWRAFTGQTYEEWQGWGWLDALHPEDRARTAALWRQSGRRPDPRQHGISPAPRQRRVALDNRPGRAAAHLDGAVRGVVGMNTDITEQQQAEAVREQLAAIVDASDDAIIGQTLDGIITSWNQGAERLYGYTAAEAIGQPIGLLPALWLDEIPQILARLQRGERIDHYETQRVARTGRGWTSRSPSRPSGTARAGSSAPPRSRGTSPRANGPRRRSSRPMPPSNSALRSAPPSWR